jgi:phosphoribosylanthranilate isomerase
MTASKQLWIKICGMTTPEAVEACLAANVDAIGFVFAESVRKVTPAKASSLAAPARGRVICTAVTRHPTQQLIDEIIAVFQPDLLQTDQDDLRGLRLPRQLQLLPVFRSEAQDPPPRLLFEGHTSGSGNTADWSTASQLARRTELILAGGLNATNVATAITTVNPFGVDVSSGVEERPGIKSQTEIMRFVSAARSNQGAGIPAGCAHVAHGRSRERCPGSTVSGQGPRRRRKR